MFRFSKKSRRFLAREDGPTAAEYAVMLGMIVLVCFAAVQSLGEAVKGMFITANSVAVGTNGGSAGGGMGGGSLGGRGHGTGGF